MRINRRSWSVSGGRYEASRQTPPGESSYGYGWSVSEEGVYSHGGSDGTFAWVDPARGVIGMVLTQTPRGRNPIDRFIELVNLSIGDARPST